MPRVPRWSRWQLGSLAIVLSILLAPSASRAGSVDTLILNPDFETTNQSLWNTGPAAVGSLTYFVGASWDASGTIGKIKNTVVLGKFGAQLSGSTSGQVGLGLSLEYNSGSLNADVKPTVSVSIPSQVVLGTPFAVSTSVTNTALGFSTVSPQAGLEVDADLTIDASGTGKLCVFGCVSKSATIDFSQQLEVLGINSNFDNKVVIFGQDVTSSVVNKAQISFGDPSTALTIAYDPGSGKIFPTFTTTSTQAAGQTVARATGSTNVVTLDVEVPNAITDLLELPGLNGSVADGLINYNLISADVTLGLGWAQTQSLQYEGAEVALKVSAPGVADQTIDIGAGSTAEITLDPSVYKNVSQVTITPTVILNSPQFTAVNALQITEGISASAFSLSGLGLSLGPLWSWSQSWSQDVPLYTAKFGVAGFTNQSSAVLYGTASLLPRGSTADPVLYTVMGSGSLSDMTLETVDPSASSGNPGSAGYPTVLPAALTLTGSTLDNTGGDLVSNPSGTTLTLTNSGILGGTIDGSTSSLTLVATGVSNQLVNVGYTGDLNVQGRLDLLWSAANTGTVTVAPVAGSGVDAVLNVQGSNLVAGTINIGPETADGLNASMSVIGGSTVNVNTLNNAGTITVGGYWNAYTPAYPNDATGVSVNPTAIAGAAYDSITAANVTNTGLITIQSGVFDAQTVSNTGGVFSVVGMGGGTSSLVLHGYFSGGEIDLNGSGAQLLLGFAQMLGVNVYSDQGLISAGSIAGEPNAGIAEQSTLTLTDGSLLAVHNGGSLTIDQSTIVADNSIIRVDGALTLQGSTVVLQNGSAILNDGSITFLPTNVVDPILTDGSQVAIDNLGSVDVEDALLMSSSTADNPLILNESGTFHVDSNGLLELDVEGASGGALAYLQTGGVTQVDGMLLMQDQNQDPEYMVMTGGTLEGQGWIVGNVINGGGTVELSQDQSPLMIAGDYQQLPAGVMELVLSGAPDSDNPELVVDTAELDGTLDLELPDNLDMTSYDPNSPWTYMFLDCVVLCSGEFSGLDWTGPDGYYWEVLYGDNSVEAELLQYAAGVGSSGVDPQTELDELQAQGGGTPPPLTVPNGPTLTINGGEFTLSPEPATWTVAAAGLGALGIWLRRKKAGGRQRTARY
jgi:hypothetical protein